MTPLTDKEKQIVETPLSDSIRFCKLSREKMYGKSPTCLVIASDYAEILWKEVLPFVMKHEELKFENPVNQMRQYMGMNVLVINEIHGGSFHWGFAE